MLLCSVSHINGAAMTVNQPCKDIWDGIDQFMKTNAASGAYTAKFEREEGGPNTLLVFTISDGIKFFDRLNHGNQIAISDHEFCRTLVSFTKGDEVVTIGPMTINSELIRFLNMSHHFDKIVLDIENFGYVDVKLGRSYAIEFSKQY